MKAVGFHHRLGRLGAINFILLSARPISGEDVKSRLSLDALVDVVSVPRTPGPKYVAVGSSAALGCEAIYFLFQQQRRH